MKSLKKKATLTSKLCILMLECFSFQNVLAQTPVTLQAPGAGGPGRAPVDTNVALIEGDLGFREHIGGHTDTLDWPTFIEFASRYFDKK